MRYDARGRHLDDHKPEGWVADLQTDRLATPERLAQARQRFLEASSADFDVVKTGPDKFLLIDRATGVEYRPVGFDPLQNADVRRQRIACFVVDGAGRVLYLRQRGVEAEPEREIVSATLLSRIEAAS